MIVNKKKLLIYLASALAIGGIISGVTVGIIQFNNANFSKRPVNNNRIVSDPSSTVDIDTGLPTTTPDKLDPTLREVQLNPEAEIIIKNLNGFDKFNNQMNTNLFNKIQYTLLSEMTNFALDNVSSQRDKTQAIVPYEQFKQSISSSLQIIGKDLSDFTQEMEIALLKPIKLMITKLFTNRLISIQISNFLLLEKDNKIYVNVKFSQELSDAMIIRARESVVETLYKQVFPIAEQSVIDEAIQAFKTKEAQQNV